MQRRRGIEWPDQNIRVRVNTLDPDRVFEGRADEDEYLIEGTVENVEFSKDATDEEDDD